MAIAGGLGVSSSNHDFRCECGTLKGEIRVSPPCNHAVCYCRDCRAFARFLGGESILDAHGGTEIVQIAASKLVFTQGVEHLAGVRLTDQGILRMYAACCSTPVGNLHPSPKVDFVGLIHSCLDTDRLTRDFGPIRAHVHTRSGPGADGPAPSGLFPAILGLLRMVVRGRATGSWRRSPFFTADGRPVGPVRVLAPDELEALKNAG